MIWACKCIMAACIILIFWRYQFLYLSTLPIISSVRTIISANDHYAGFGPGTVNNFREIMDMRKISLEHRNDIIIPKYSYLSNSESNTARKASTQKQKQTSMSDFMEK